MHPKQNWNQLISWIFSWYAVSTTGGPWTDPKVGALDLPVQDSNQSWNPWKKYTDNFTWKVITITIKDSTLLTYLYTKCKKMPFSGYGKKQDTPKKGYPLWLMSLWGIFLARVFALFCIVEILTYGWLYVRVVLGIIFVTCHWWSILMSHYYRLVVERLIWSQYGIWQIAEKCFANFGGW